METDITLNLKTGSNSLPQKKSKSNDKKEMRFQKYAQKKMLNQKRNRETSKSNTEEKTKHFFDKPKSKPANLRKKSRSKIERIEDEIKKNLESEENIVEENTENVKNSVFSLENFQDLPINQYIIKDLIKHNFNQMTNIQKKAIPVLLKNQNVVFKSETGSGKTLAYVVPLLELLNKINLENKIDRSQGPYALIFAPTHELCLQIETTFTMLKSSNVNIVPGTLLGGQKIAKEKSKIRKGLNIIICTPGRLLYHLKNTQILNFKNLKFMIFDEADRLLDMGFHKEIKECLDSIMGQFNLDANIVENFRRFNIFLISATLDKNTKSLVANIMTEFKTVGFKKNDEDSIQIPDGLKQYYTQVYDEYKLIHLIGFLYSFSTKKIIIFVSTCETVNFLFQIIKNFVFFYGNQRFFEKNEVFKLHGKMKHDERKEVFKCFFNSSNAFLISTDVASRGLDFPTVDWIVHYDVNPEKKDYINRMGRTARLDKRGNSILFLMQNEIKLLETVFKEFNIAHLQNSKIMIKFSKTFNRNLFKAIKASGNKSDESSQYIELRNDENLANFNDSDEYFDKLAPILDPIRKSIKNFIFQDRENLILARSAMNTSIKSYTTFFKYQKDVFNVKALNLPRFARSFGLYKEKSTFKLGTEEYKIDQIKEKSDKNNEKFLKTQEKMNKLREDNKNRKLLDEFM